jgi:hypothetical protein
MLRINSLSVSSARAAVIIIAVMLIIPVVVTGQASGLKKVEYNKEYLVQNVVVGTIAPARLGSTPYRLGADGTVSVLPATGSITLNFRTGDTAVKLAGDHVEPAVTLYYSDDRNGSESRAFNILSCVGNEVKVLTGEAKGASGVVIGKHGGSEHVMVDFKNPEVLKTMLPGDKMAVYAYGVGMELTNAKDVKTMNMSPQLIEAFTKAGMGITPAGKLRVPVALTVPAKIMGSGLGSDHVYSGDYDIQMFDETVNREYGLDKLRFGDIVAIIDADNSYGRIYRTGAITIGVITHSGSVIAGHGPGVTTLFTSSTGNIEFYTDPKANLLFLLLQ